MRLTGTAEETELCTTEELQGIVRQSKLHNSRKYQRFCVKANIRQTALTLEHKIEIEYTYDNGGRGKLPPS